jgi:hypothetical protein
VDTPLDRLVLVLSLPSVSRVVVSFLPICPLTCMARCRAHLEHDSVVFVVATGSREEGEEEEGRYGQGNRGWTRGRGLYFVFLVV